MQINIPVLRQFSGFAGIGAIGTAGHYLALIGLVQLVGVSPVLATAVGFTVGALVNYHLSYRFIFRSNKRHRESMSKFFAVALVGMILNGIVVSLGINVVHLHYLVAQIMATAIVLVWNFMINKMWTFSGPSKE